MAAEFLPSPGPLVRWSATRPRRRMGRGGRPAVPPAVAGHNRGSHAGPWRLPLPPRIDRAAARTTAPGPREVLTPTQVTSLRSRTAPPARRSGRGRRHARRNIRGHPAIGTGQPKCGQPPCTDCWIAFGPQTFSGLYHDVQACTIHQMARTMTVSEARAALPKILERVTGGEEVTITRHGKAVAIVVRPDTLRARRAERALDAAAGVGELLETSRKTPIRRGSVLSEARAEELVAHVRAGRSRG